MVAYFLLISCKKMKNFVILLEYSSQFQYLMSGMDDLCSFDKEQAWA